MALTFSLVEEHVDTLSILIRRVHLEGAWQMSTHGVYHNTNHLPSWQTRHCSTTTPRCQGGGSRRHSGHSSVLGEGKRGRGGGGMSEGVGGGV